MKLYHNIFVFIEKHGLRLSIDPVTFLFGNGFSESDNNSNNRKIQYFLNMIHVLFKHYHNDFYAVNHHVSILFNSKRF